MIFSNFPFAVLGVVDLVGYVVNIFHIGSSKAAARLPTVLQLAPHACPTYSAKSLQDMVTRALEGLERKKRISLLGSTGSFGTQTLQIYRETWSV